MPEPPAVEEGGEAAIEAPEDAPDEPKSNLTKSTIILAKTVIGAGIAAIPLTDALLGWPLALAFLALLAAATYGSLNILVRRIVATGCTSYPEVTRKLLGRWAGVLLEVSIIAFGLGLMIVYGVVIGDMLVGKEGFPGLLCSWLGGAACSRPLVVGLVTALVLLPAVSFRSMEASAGTSWVGMGALCMWAAGTLVLLAAAVARGEVRGTRLLPDVAKLGGGGLRAAAGVVAVIPVLTTAFSCQAAAPFVMAELRPRTPRSMTAVSAAAVAIATGLYAFISVGSYAVFGPEVQADVLHNYTPARLELLLPAWLARALFVAVRLSFLLGVVTLYPLMMFPAREGLVRLLSGRTQPLPPAAFYPVTYGIVVALFLVSVAVPSIWGPIQIIGATAGAVIGFIVPGLLAFRQVGGRPEEQPLLEQGGQAAQWELRRPFGWALIVIGVVQSVTGVASQLMGPS